MHIFVQTEEELMTQEAARPMETGEAKFSDEVVVEDQVTLSNLHSSVLLGMMDDGNGRMFDLSLKRKIGFVCLLACVCVDCTICFR